MRSLSQLNKVNKFSFCVGQAYLTPEKHITMSHNPQNMYEDIIMLGDYPLAAKSNDKILSRKYEAPVLEKIFSHLKSKNPNMNIPKMNYEQLMFTEWSKFNVDFESEKAEILKILSQEIFVSENKNRYLIEQKNRLITSQNVFSFHNMNDFFVGYFVEQYLEIIRENAELSNNFRAPKIRGPDSEIQKFYERQYIQNEGLKELEEDNQENQTFINKLMKYIHS